MFATGFVLRYAPLYRKVKELLDTGKFGKIMQIEANEHIPSNHGSHIMRNWRRHTDISGPHILEKCCHDLDLIIWYSQSLPSKIASFASRDFFVPANRGRGVKELMRSKPGRRYAPPAKKTEKKPALQERQETYGAGRMSAGRYYSQK